MTTTASEQAARYRSSIDELRRIRSAPFYTGVFKSRIARPHGRAFSSWRRLRQDFKNGSILRIMRIRLGGGPGFGFRRDAAIILAMATLDIARLTPKERLDLIGELWDSLDPADVDLTPEQEAELARRMATFEADKRDARPWSEIDAELDRPRR